MPESFIMKICHVLFSMLCIYFTLVSGFSSYADQGDTTLVQTFTFGSPQIAEFLFSLFF